MWLISFCKFFDVIAIFFLFWLIFYLYANVCGTSKCCDEMVKSLNANQLKKMNKSYVCFLEEISLTNNNKKYALNHKFLYLPSHFSSLTSKHSQPSVPLLIMTLFSLYIKISLSTKYMFYKQRNTLVNIQNS
jgi:hypothetical protein